MISLWLTKPNTFSLNYRMADSSVNYISLHSVKLLQQNHRQGQKPNGLIYVSDELWPEKQSPFLRNRSEGDSFHSPCFQAAGGNFLKPTGENLPEWQPTLMDDRRGGESALTTLRTCR